MLHPPRPRAETTTEDNAVIGQRVRARLCYDRRQVYAGVIERRSDLRLWEADEDGNETEYAVYCLRVENKLTYTGYVNIFQPEGEWQVLAYKPEDD